MQVKSTERIFENESFAPDPRTVKVPTVPTGKAWIEIGRWFQESTLVPPKHVELLLTVR